MSKINNDLQFTLLVINSKDAREYLNHLNRQIPSLDTSPYFTYVNKVANSNKKLLGLKNWSKLTLLALRTQVAMTKNINPIIKNKFIKKIDAFIDDYENIIFKQDADKARQLFDRVKHITYVIGKKPRRLRYMKYVDNLLIQQSLKDITSDELVVIKSFMLIAMPNKATYPAYNSFGFIDRKHYTIETHKRIEGLTAWRTVEKAGLYAQGVVSCLVAVHKSI